VSRKTIKMSKLNLDTALRIGRALTINLDTLSSICSPEDFTLDAIRAEAAKRLADQFRLVFGVEGPAGAICSVRVESFISGYDPTVNARNEFEVKPERGGPIKMQQVFNQTIESMEP
jgi:hypothetical protein